MATKIGKLEKAAGSIQRRLHKGLAEALPIGVQKSYFMLSDDERDILNTALDKYRPGQRKPILVGGNNQLKPALRLMTDYRLVIEEIKDADVTSYTRWVDTVQVRGSQDQEEVYLTFSPRFERIWLKAKKRLVDYASKKPANIGLRSQYALRLYNWAKKYVAVGSKRVPLSGATSKSAWSGRQFFGRC